MLTVRLIQSSLTDFLLMLMGVLTYCIMDPLLGSFTLLLQDGLKLNDQGQQSLLLERTLHSVTLCCHTTSKDSTLHMALSMAS